jgi:hypothetical protein
LADDVLCCTSASANGLKGLNEAAAAVAAAAAGGLVDLVVPPPLADFSAVGALADWLLATAAGAMTGLGIGGSCSERVWRCGVSVDG